MTSEPTDHRGPNNTPGSAAGDRTGRPDAAARSRSGAVWTAVVCALVLLVLLIVFFLQNEAPVLVTFFGLEGSIALGLALLIAAVGGGLVVALVGAVRIIRLRATARRAAR